MTPGVANRVAYRTTGPLPSSYTVAGGDTPFGLPVLCANRFVPRRSGRLGWVETWFYPTATGLVEVALCLDREGQPGPDLATMVFDINPLGDYRVMSCKGVAVQPVPIVAGVPYWLVGRPGTQTLLANWAGSLSEGRRMHMNDGRTWVESAAPRTAAFAVGLRGDRRPR